MISIATLREQTLTIRRSIVKLAGANAAQADVIPAGWKNNLRWHTGHLVVTPQLLTHKLLGEPMECPENYRAWFGKGTSPENWNGAEIPPFEQLLAEVVEYSSALFEQIAPRCGTKFPEAYTTSNGVTLTTPAEALNFSFCHDGIHLGLLLALSRALKG